MPETTFLPEVDDFVFLFVVDGFFEPGCACHFASTVISIFAGAYHCFFAGSQHAPSALASSFWA